MQQLNTHRLDVEALHNNPRSRRYLERTLKRKGIPAYCREDAYQSLMLECIEKADEFDSSKGATELTRVAHYHLPAVASKMNYHIHRDVRRLVSVHQTAEDDEAPDGLLETSFAGVVEDAHSEPEVRTRLVKYIESLSDALTLAESAVMNNLGLDLLHGQLAGADLAAAAKDLDSTPTTVRRHVCNIRSKARRLWAQHFDVDLTKSVEERIVITH